MKTGLKYIIGGVGLAIVAIVCRMGWQYYQQPPLPAGFASGNGRVEAVEVDISTKIAGRVEAVLAAEGDLVQAGQVLATMDAEQLQAQKMRAEADIAAAESQLDTAQALIAHAQAQKTLAEQELERAAQLVKRDLTSREEHDTRVSQLAVAQANLDAAESTLVSRQRSLDARHADHQAIQTQIDDATLVSPSTGRVLYRLAEPGEVLGVGGKVLTMINLADVYMEVFLPSAQAHRVAIGAEARIKLDILDFAIPATVSFVSPESQFTPKQVETSSERDKLMFRVKVRIPQELVTRHIDEVKTGVRGVAYIRLTPASGETPPPWPTFLQRLPPDYQGAALSQQPAIDPRD
ncbi:MAG: HlyD family efflux transporter periplasmic adaptor subunit [Halioglobus sp.]|nr:HlyD family efflux transporter periplasmic adaptor subunit [Halioglobus sp.]